MGAYAQRAKWFGWVGGLQVNSVTIPQGRGIGGNQGWEDVTSRDWLSPTKAMRIRGTWQQLPASGGFTESGSLKIAFDPDEPAAGNPAFLLAPAGAWGGNTTVAFDMVSAWNTQYSVYVFTPYPSGLGGPENTVLASRVRAGAPAVTPPNKWRLWRDGQWAPTGIATFTVEYLTAPAG
jgi:hypothetical protein